MFPGMGRMNPKQMQGLMKQFGIKSEELQAKSVELKLADGKVLVIEEPNVSVMHVQGQKVYSVTGGKEREGASAGEEVPEEDVKMVAEQSGASKENARKALKETKGDLAEAIEKLKK
ncbi:MAG: nascent polypeptide-associated complex protein [Candidatus Diapherotrites archaeon]